MPVSVEAWSRACGLTSNGARVAFTCDVFGSTDVDFADVPEVMVQELVVEE